MSVAKKAPTGGPRRIAVFDPAAFRQSRLAAGLSVYELAKLAAVTAPAIGNWEAGRSQPSAAAYGRVLNVLFDAEESMGCALCSRRRNL